MAADRTVARCDTAAVLPSCGEGPSAQKWGLEDVKRRGAYDSGGYAIGRPSESIGLCTSLRPRFRTSSAGGGRSTRGGGPSSLPGGNAASGCESGCNRIRSPAR